MFPDKTELNLPYKALLVSAYAVQQAFRVGLIPTPPAQC